MRSQTFEAFFAAAPPSLDTASIHTAWQALNVHYGVEDRGLPIPVWARRPLTETGNQAWQTLSQDVAEIASDRPLSIYVHIPFCAEKCSFCDCYSFKLGDYQEQHIQGYITLLEQEIQLWRRLGTLAHRPVTTVHFGGGTPTFLGQKPFARLVQSLRQHFNVSPNTEWALESTSTELTADMIAGLESLGVNRLHLGVQTLDENIRRILKRRDSAKNILDKIARLVARSWVVSVDLIYGLPGQTLVSFWQDIIQLTSAGVDGFSLYELQTSSHNRKFAMQYSLAQTDYLKDYFLFQAASWLLLNLGYRKDLFNHFANKRDKNLYFTFPERGEDLLALGTIADGVFNDYHYRHTEYRHYTKSVTAESPGLCGGLRRNAIENCLHPLETAILSTRIIPSLFMQVLGKTETETLFTRWKSAHLVASLPQEKELMVTANGSWLVAKMLMELVTFLKSP